MDKTKYEVGEKVNNWTVLELPIHHKKGYKVQCKCGLVMYKLTSNLRCDSQCQTCANKSRRKYKVGDKFEDWTIIEIIELKEVTYKIECKCGEQKLIVSRSLRTSCKCNSCFRKNEALMHLKNAQGKVGKKIGNFKIQSFYHKNELYKFLCKCKCGNIRSLRYADIKHVKSCGCMTNQLKARGEQIASSRFTEAEILAMRELNSINAYSRKELTVMFNISEDYLEQVLRGKVWKHLLPDKK